MENTKNTGKNPEVKDEELDQVTGGAGPDPGHHYTHQERVHPENDPGSVLPPIQPKR